jgi:hypothetical protein
MQGISLLAIGNRTYGTWAYHLARSLRWFHPDVLIQLVHEPDTVKDVDTSVFDVMTEIDAQDARRGGKLSPSWAKLRIVNYYPLSWEKVMFLDVDALAIAPFMHLFDLDSEFKIHTWATTDQKDGVFGNMLWLKIHDMRRIFDLPDQVIPGTNSSFQVMKLGDEAEAIYREAQEAYVHFEANYSSRHLHMQWGKKRNHNAALPDELFFNVALARRSGYDGLKPILFHTTGDGRLDLDEAVKNGKCFLGYWGDKGYNSMESRSTYNRLIKRYSKAPGQVVEGLLKQKFVNFN